MPKSQLDWLGVVSLWLGAAIMAVKAADLTLIAGAPAWLAANWWSYVPLGLISIYLVIAIYRGIRTLPAPAITFDMGEREPKRQTSIRSSAPSRDRVVVVLENARNSARRAMIGGNAAEQLRAAERQMPSLRAAMLTAHKALGIPIPPEGKSPLLALELHCRLIEEILPYLKQGHEEEARMRAERFVDFLLAGQKQDEN